MVEKISFGGGLDTDSGDRLVQNGDYRKMLNCRSSITGVVENIPSFEKIDFTLPIGVNKVIGAFSDKLNDTILYFVSNNNSEDLILEYDARLDAIVEVLRGELGFTEDSLINHIDAIGDLRSWTDGDNPPRKINIEKAKAGFYGANPTEQAISAVKYAPTCPPDVEYQSSATSAVNNLRGKLYQFRYKWVYTDGEESAWSAISYLRTPPTEFLYYPFGDQPSTIDNELKVTLETGTFLVDRIKVAVRRVSDSNAPGDFYLVQDIDKDEFGIADDTLYEFIYDGERVESPIALRDSNRLYDFMPLKAESQAVTKGNRLVYAGVTEGYDNVPVKATAEVLYTEIPPEPVLTIAPATDTASSPTPTPPATFTGGKLSLSAFTLSNTPNPGDVVSLKMSIRIDAQYRSDQLTYLVQAGDTLADIIDGLALECQNSTALNPPERTKEWQLVDDPVFPTYNLTAQFSNAQDVGLGPALENWYTDIIPGGGPGQFIARTWSRKYVFPAGPLGTSFSFFEGHSPTGGGLVNRIGIDALISNPIKPTKTFKKGSKHQLAIQYYDAANRSGLSNISDQLAFEVSFFSNSVDNGFNGVRLRIKHQPPEWAVKWQVLYGGRASVGRFIQTELSGVVAGSNGEFTASLSELTSYNDDINGVLTYDFAKGDRMRVIQNSSLDYLGVLADVEVVGYDSGFDTITFKGTDDFDMTDAKLVEIYAPRAEEDEILFNEIGRCYPVRNPGTEDRAHGTNGEENFGFFDQDQTIGVQDAELHIFDSGDVYFKERSFDVLLAPPSPRTYQIEDANYSDFYASAAWDKGRPSIEDKNFAQRFNKARAYFTEPLIEGSLINGSSTIYDLSFKDYDRALGAIKRLYAEDTQLIMFQELKVSKILVNEDMLFDSNGSSVGSVDRQNQVLSDAIAYSGEYGIGCNPESFAVYGKRKYFIDAERGAVLRLGLEGITPISRMGKQKFFSNKLKDLLKANKDFNAFGGYDVENGEYILSFEAQTELQDDPAQKGGVIIVETIPGETLAYNEDVKRWGHEYSWQPDYMSQAIVEMFSFKDGEIYKHPLDSDSRNNFYGVQYPMILEFVSNENPSEVKFYRGIFTESTDAFSMIATNQFGQQTSLITSDFELREGQYFSAILRDENTPNVSNPLLEGDEMRSHSMVVELTNESTERQTLFSVGLRHEASMLTNY